MGPYLKPCPRCAGQCGIATDHVGFWAFCRECDLAGPNRSSAFFAAQFWNDRPATLRRAPRPVQSALPPVLYLVVREGRTSGIGSDDTTGHYDTAYDQFAEAVEHGDPVAVFQIAIADGRPVSVSDQTDAFERDLQEISLARGLDWPEVTRLHSAPVLLAAE